MLGLKHFARVQTFRRKYVKILYCKFDQIWDMCTCIFGIFCLIFVVSDHMWKCCVLWLKIDLILDVCVHFWNPLPFFGIGKYVKMLCAVIENWFNLRCMYAFLESSTFLPPRPHNTQPSPSDKAIVSQATTWFMISNTPIPSTNTPNNTLELDQFLF